MNLNSKGKLAKFYMWLPPDDKKLPKDLCTFFWGLVLRSFIIFGMGGMILVWEGWFSVIYAIIQCALFAWAHKVATLYIMLLMSIPGIGIWLSERKKKVELFSETRKVIKAKVEGIKGRYCPRINWMSEENERPVKPGNCTCRYPDIIIRNMNGHDETCPVYVEWYERVFKKEPKTGEKETEGGS